MKTVCAVFAAFLLVWAKAETTSSDQIKSVVQKQEDNDDDNSVDIRSVQAQSKEEFDESATQEDLDRMIKNLKKFRWLLAQQENKNKDEEDENSFIESLAKEMIVREQSIERAKNLFRKINSGEIKLLQSPSDSKTSLTDSDEEKLPKTKDEDSKENTDKDTYIESWLRKKAQMKNLKNFDSFQTIDLNDEEEEDFGWWDEEKPEEHIEEEPVPLTPQEQEGIFYTCYYSTKNITSFNECTEFNITLTSLIKFFFYS